MKNAASRRLSRSSYVGKDWCRERFITRFYFLNLGKLDTSVYIYVHVHIFFFVAPRELQKIGKISDGCHSNWTSAQQVNK